MQAQCPMCKTLINLVGETCTCPGCGRTLAVPASMRTQPPPPSAEFAPTPPRSEPPPPAPRYDPPRPALPFNNDDRPRAPVRRLTRDDDDYDDDYDDRPIIRRRRRKRESADYASARLQTNWLLFGIAGLQVVCGAVLLAAGPQNFQIPKEQRDLITVILIGTAFLYTGLGFWSLFQPLPPAIIGLVVYVVIAIMDIIAAPEILRNPGFWIRIAIMGGLIKCIASLANSR